MGIFSFRNREKASGADEKSRASEWNNITMPSPDSGEKTNSRIDDAFRRRRKILVCYALGEDSFPDVISESNAKLVDDYRDDLLERIANGTISEGLKVRLLLGVKTPLDRDDLEYPEALREDGAYKDSDMLRQISAERLDPNKLQPVFGSLSKNEKRILSFMTQKGFNNWANTDAGSIRDFMGRYFTPKHFEKDSNNFLDGVERRLGQEQRAKFEGIIESFKHKIYGEQYDYYKQMEALEDEAFDYYEREHSREWPAGSFSYCQTSRSQSRDGLVSRENLENGLWADNSCEDQIFVDGEKQLYAVFDGAGGMSNPRLAAQTASETLASYSREVSFADFASQTDAAGSEDVASKYLATALNAADVRVRETNGCSTGVAALVTRINGRPALAYANVGDSRIYIVNMRGEATQITSDEGFGSQINNALGGSKEPGKDCCEQHGIVALRAGDRVVICSDGITGDNSSNEMSSNELGMIVHRSRGAQDASRNLVANARKRDDRTAIVFVPDFDRV